MKFALGVISMLACSGLTAAWAQERSDTTVTPRIKELKEIAITAQKQTFEFKTDKIVYNVAASVNAIGINALELLKRSPGVMVDNNNNISLNGKNGVTIYIDGKPTYMQGDAVTAMLKSLQSAGISSIEIIANPGSKYDAAGAGGIINIRLKKLTGTGYNGDVSAGFHYGISPKTDAAVSMNYRTGRYNVYANYNHYFGYNNMHYDFIRIQKDQHFDTRTKDTDMRNPINFKTGIDITLGPKSTIGAMLNGNIFNGPGLTNTNTYIHDKYTGELQQVLIAKSDYYYQHQNWMNYNANYQYRDGDKQSFSMDLDYGRHAALYRNISYNTYKEKDTLTTISSSTIRTINSSNIDVYGIKADYEHTLWKGRLSAGAKGAFIRSANNVQSYDVTPAAEIINYNRSNTFSYNENIYAAYTSYEKQVGKMKIQLGVRLEQTDAHGLLQAQNTGSEKDTMQKVRNYYLDVFPNAGITYSSNDKHIFTLAYGKRIERPSYANLNPFMFLLDELTYWKGNAFLQPQYVHNISFTYAATNIVAATLSYSITKNLSASITDTTEGNKIMMLPQNLGTQHLLNLNLTSTRSLTDWWQATFNGNVFYLSNDISFASRNLQMHNTAFNVNLQQTFNIDKKTKAEISALYNSPTVWGGYERSKYSWTTDIGIQRKVWKDKGYIKLALSDVFKTSRWYSIQSFDDFYFSNKGGRDSRQIKINIGYRFGNNKIRANQRSSGLEQESQRVK
jgi:hypothetical protein